MSITANRVALEPHEREAIANMILDAFAPLASGPFNVADAARLFEGRVAVLLATRGERGYREGWTARSGGCIAPNCTQRAGHMGAHE